MVFLHFIYVYTIIRINAYCQISVSERALAVLELSNKLGGESGCIRRDAALRTKAAGRTRDQINLMSI